MSYCYMKNSKYTYTTQRIQKSFVEGYKAYNENKTLLANPYPKVGELRSAWFDGFDQAVKDKIILRNYQASFGIARNI